MYRRTGAKQHHGGWQRSPRGPSCIPGSCSAGHRARYTRLRFEQLERLLVNARYSEDFPGFRLLACRISDSARRGRSKHSVAEQSAALSYGAASWTLDCRAQAESNRSQVRRQRFGSGSAVVRLIGLGRPRPTTVKLERTSSGQVLRNLFNTETGRNQSGGVKLSLPYLSLKTHTQRGSRDGV